MNAIWQAVEAASNRWMKAWVDRDSAVLEESLAEDFTLIMSAAPSGQFDRASWLSTACTRYVASEFRYRDVQIRDLGGGTAVMSSIAEFKAEVDGIPREGPLFLVDVWRQLGGRWQVCVRYSSNPEPTSKSAEAVGALPGD